MMSRTQVQVVVAGTLLVFALGILFSGGSPQSAWLQYYSYAVTFAVVLLGLWDRWLWRLKPVQRLKSVPHDLTGTWRGTLTSFWIDPVTGSSPAPKPAYLVVRQTSSNISVTMLTDEMRSRSSLAAVARIDGASTLTYMYLSRPDNRVEARSRMHHGSTSLDITGTPASRLRGHYWTDRDSRGELDFVDRVPFKADDFDQAQAQFQSVSPSNE